MRGYTLGRFSFNAGGRPLRGLLRRRHLKIEMNFLPTCTCLCETCQWQALQPGENLEVHYKGKTTADVLEMPGGRSRRVLRRIHPDRAPPNTPVDVGLATFAWASPQPPSGGEAQRA